MTAVVAGTACRPVLSLELVRSIGLETDRRGRGVIRATITGSTWTAEATAGSDDAPVLIGTGALEAQGCRLPPC